MLIKNLTAAQQIRVLIAAQFLLLVATSMSQPFWPLILKQQMTTSSELHYSIWNTLLYTLPVLLTAITAPIWGSLADRYGYKKMLLRATICLITTQSLLIFMHTPWQSCLCLLLQGAFSGSIAASQALGTRMVSKEQQSIVISQLQSIIALGMMVGPVVGGYIFQLSHYTTLFKVSALLCFIACLLLCYFIKEPVSDHQTTTPHSQQAHHTASAYFIPIAIFLAQTARFIILPIFAAYVTAVLKQKITVIGILYGASSMALFLSAPLIGKFFDLQKSKNKNKYLLPSIALFISFILYSLLPYTTHYILAFLNRCIWGCCLAAITPLLYSINIDCYAEKYRGKAIGFASTANKSGSLCGILLGSFFSYKFGIVCTLQLIAYFYLINFFYLTLLGSKSLREMISIKKYIQRT